MRMDIAEVSPAVAIPTIPERDGKYLSFRLGREEFGIGINRIREIIGLLPVTAVPGAPSFVLGVINLRGRVIPIVDLRRHFGLAAVEPTVRTCIIVVEVEGGRHRRVGLVVDAVSEVLAIRAEEVEDAPALGTAGDTVIMGMAKVAGGIKILLAIERILQPGEIDRLASGAPQTAFESSLLI